MRKQSLYSYLTDIEMALAQGKAESAVIHCQHIISQYPEHVKTHKVLGQALYESGQQDEAIDVLQYVVTADPEDSDSHITLAQAYQGKGMLHQAILHTERAFELNPYDSDVQVSLKSLYGERDGTLPERIPLTRGALARLYYRGKLYQQAIAEVRRSLAEDPDRLDLQLLLAETLWSDGKHGESADLCNDILRKSPNSIKATAILAAIGNKDGATQYRDKLTNLILPDRTQMGNDLVIDNVFEAYLDQDFRVEVDRSSHALPVANDEHDLSDHAPEADIVSDVANESDEDVTVESDEEVIVESDEQEEIEQLLGETEPKQPAEINEMVVAELTEPELILDEDELIAELEAEQVEPEEIVIDEPEEVVEILPTLPTMPLVEPEVVDSVAATTEDIPETSTADEINDEWLKDLNISVDEEDGDESDESADEILDWLRGAVDDESAVGKGAAVAGAAAIASGVINNKPETPEEVVDKLLGDDVPDWLDDLSADEKQDDLIDQLAAAEKAKSELASTAEQAVSADIIDAQPTEPTIEMEAVVDDPIAVPDEPEVVDEPELQVDPVAEVVPDVPVVEMEAVVDEPVAVPDEPEVVADPEIQVDPVAEAVEPQVTEPAMPVVIETEPEPDPILPVVEPQATVHAMGLVDDVNSAADLPVEPAVSDPPVSQEIKPTTGSDPLAAARQALGIEEPESEKVDEVVETAVNDPLASARQSMGIQKPELPVESVAEDTADPLASARQSMGIQKPELPVESVAEDTADPLASARQSMGIQKPETPVEPVVEDTADPLASARQSMGIKNTKPSVEPVEEDMSNPLAAARKSMGITESQAPVTEAPEIKEVDIVPAQPTVAAMGLIPENDKAEVEEPVVPEPDVVVAQPTEAVMETIPAKTDDLTKIEGVGKKIAGVLNNNDITKFSQLAETDAKQLTSYLRAAGSQYNRHDPASWPKQASLAASGEWEMLKAMQDQLDGGKYVINATEDAVEKSEEEELIVVSAEEDDEAEEELIVVSAPQEIDETPVVAETVTPEPEKETDSIEDILSWLEDYDKEDDILGKTVKATGVAGAVAGVAALAGKDDDEAKPEEVVDEPVEPVVAEVTADKPEPEPTPTPEPETPSVISTKADDDVMAWLDELENSTEEETEIVAEASEPEAELVPETPAVVEEEPVAVVETADSKPAPVATDDSNSLAEEKEDVMAWLNQIEGEGEEQASAEEIIEATASVPAAIVPPAVDVVAPIVEEPIVAKVVEPEPPAEEEDDIIAWLSDLEEDADADDVTEEELAEILKSTADDVPDVVVDPEPIIAAPIVEEPVVAKAVEPEAAVTSPEPDDDVVAWLNALEQDAENENLDIVNEVSGSEIDALVGMPETADIIAETPIIADQVETAPTASQADEEDDVLEWLNELEEDAAEEAVADMVEPVADIEPETIADEPIIETASAKTEESEDVLAWLNQLEEDSETERELDDVPIASLTEDTSDIIVEAEDDVLGWLEEPDPVALPSKPIEEVNDLSWLEQIASNSDKETQYDPIDAIVAEENKTKVDIETIAPSSVSSHDVVAADAMTQPAMVLPDGTPGPAQQVPSEKVEQQAEEVVEANSDVRVDLFGQEESVLEQELSWIDQLALQPIRVGMGSKIDSSLAEAVTQHEMKVPERRQTVTPIIATTSVDAPAPVGEEDMEEALTWLETTSTQGDEDFPFELNQEIVDEPLTPPMPHKLIEPDLVVSKVETFDEMPDDPDEIVAWIENQSDDGGQPMQVADEIKLAAAEVAETLFGGAREQLRDGDVTGAAKSYAAMLIQDKGNAGLVVGELESAVNSHSDQPLLYRVLGDAYKETGQLSKSLQAYNKAMDLMA